MKVESVLNRWQRQLGAPPPAPCPANSKRRLTAKAVAPLVLIVTPCFVFSCHKSPTPAPGSQPEKKMTTLTISKQTDGAEIEIGQLVFDASNNATLTTEGSGPDADELKRVWADTSQRKSLPMEWTEKTKVDGNLKTTRKSKDVAKGDAEYPAAVWSYLESTHGYLVDKE